MTTHDIPRGTLLVGGLLILLVASRLLMSAVTGFTKDDAYITYRYAANLAAGKGFVYNSGEKVQGTSTPLYTMILASACLITGPEPLPAVSKIFGLMADVISLILLVRILVPLGRSGQFLGGILFALFPKQVFASTEGMEAPLVIVLMLLTISLVQKDRLNIALVCSALLLMMRADAVIWVGSLFLIVVWQRRRLPMFPVGISASLYAGWLGFSLLYFGSVLPHAITAKEESWHHLFPVFDPMRVLLGYFPFHGLSGIPPVLQGSAVLLLLIPAVVALLDLLRQKSLLAVFPLFFLLYNLVFSFARVIMEDWYYLPGYLAFFVTLACLWQAVLSRQEAPGSAQRLDLAAKIFVPAALCVLLLVGIQRWAKDPGEWFQTGILSVAQWLNTHAPPGSSILLEPIGYVGWESGLYVHDVVGLVSPRVLDYRRRYHGSDSWFMQYVRDEQPTYILFQDWELGQNLLFLGHGDGIFSDQESRNWFSTHYRNVDLKSGRPDPGESRGAWHQFVLYARSVEVAEFRTERSVHEEAVTSRP